MNLNRELNAILTISVRDLIRFIRDKPRILISFIFPFLFIGVLGSSLQANLGKDVGFNFLAFVFVGVLGQTLFQSTASGIISLIEDRENNFSQELFVAPISRYSLIIGKILGESLVSVAHVIGILFFGFIIGVPITFVQLISMIPAAILICLLGGAFGVLVLANLGNQRSANQIFPLIIFPQFFLAGVFNPITKLPPILFVLSRITPMTYAVDLFRSIYYFGRPEYKQVVLHNTPVNLAVVIGMFLVFLILGTHLFIQNERNR